MKQFFPLLIFFLIVMALTLGSALFSRSAPPSAIHPLAIGDQFPPIRPAISINGTPGQEAFDPSSHKLIILEFINTHCGTCRKSIPQLQRIQSAFPDEVSIILATGQKDSIVRKAVKKYGWSLPVITEDTTLNKLFPYQTVPHQVWIRDQEVLAITHWQYANEENISKLIAGQRLKSPLKQEDPIDISKPLTQNNIHPYYQSAITPRIRFGSGTYKSENQYLVYNADIKKLFRIAYGMPAFPINAYVHTEVGDSLSQLIDGPDAHITGYFQEDSAYLAWRDEQTFCYNLIYPEGTTISKPQLQQAMQQDLNQFFHQHMGLSGFLEKRLTKCLVLSNISNDTSFHTSGGKPSFSRSGEDYHITNQPISLLIGQIAYRHSQLGMPVINDTGYTGNVDLSFSGDLGDLDHVNKGLAQYGLQFVQQNHEMEVVVLKETPPTN